jgi:hypothetical protein
MKASPYERLHVHVPLFRKRHTLVNAAPGKNSVLSGTVRSSTKSTWLHGSGVAVGVGVAVEVAVGDGVAVGIGVSVGIAVKVDVGEA